MDTLGQLFAASRFLLCTACSEAKPPRSYMAHDTQHGAFKEGTLLIEVSPSRHRGVHSVHKANKPLHPSGDGSTYMLSYTVHPATLWPFSLCITQGVSKGNECETCGEDFKTCPGHFGHVRFALPVFHVGYFRSAITLLQTICKVSMRFSLSLSLSLPSICLPSRSLCTWSHALVSIVALSPPCLLYTSDAADD